MTKKAGADAVLNIGGTPIAGVRMSNVSVDATPITVTDKDSGGLQEFLAGRSSSKALAFAVDGVEDDGVLQTLALTPGTDMLLTDLTFALSSGVVISGDFFFGSYAEGNPYEEATTFNASFASSGLWTYTAAP
jgi:predicted secreted protein